MNKVCPLCGNDLKMIPQGVSKKTGKPYNSFLACSDRDCGHTEPVSTQESLKTSSGNNKEVMRALRLIYKEIKELKLMLNIADPKPIDKDEARLIFEGDDERFN